MKVGDKVIDYKPLGEMREETIKGIHDILEIFSGHNIPIWLDYGTLLGAIREKDIIAHDYDVDLGMFAVDLPRVLELKTHFETKGFIVDLGFRYGPEENKEDRMLSVIIFHRDNIHFEVHPWHLKGPLRHRLKCYKDKEYVICWAKKEFFENMEKIDFLHRQWLVPTPAQEYLDFMYDGQWREPLAYFSGDRTNVRRVEKREDVEEIACQMCRQELTKDQRHILEIHKKKFTLCGWDACRMKEYLEGNINGHVINIFWGAGHICQNSWISLRDILRKNNITEVLEIGTGLSSECFVNEGIQLISMDSCKPHSELYQRLVSMKGKGAEFIYYEGDPAVELDKRYPGRKWRFVFVDSPHERSKEVRLAMARATEMIYLHDPNSGEQGFFPNGDWQELEKESKLFLRRQNGV